MRWFFVPVRDDEGKVIGYFERHEMHWDFSDPGKPVAVPKLKQDIKTKQAAHRVCKFCAPLILCAFKFTRNQRS